MSTREGLKKKRISGFKTLLPAKSAFTIETAEDFPKLHTLTIASGKRGGGKSVAVANFIKKCKDNIYFDRVWLVTPTYWSNKTIWDIAEIEEEDIHEPTLTILKEIQGMVDDERDEWDDFLLRKEQYKQFQQDMRKKPITELDELTLLEYQEKGFFEGPPEWKYKKEQPPRLGLILDDTLGTPLMSKPSAGLINMCIKHRHLGRGLGISIFMLVQSYCSHGGINRAIRENCTMLWLFRVNQEQQLKKIIEESDLPVSEEKFMEMCRYCHDIPFNYLLLDFSPKTEDQRFRSGMSEYIQ